MIRKLESALSGGAGVMADDILAGLYANIILQCICMQFRTEKTPMIRPVHQNISEGAEHLITRLYRQDIPMADLLRHLGQISIAEVSMSGRVLLCGVDILFYSHPALHRLSWAVIPYDNQNVWCRNTKHPVHRTS